MAVILEFFTCLAWFHIDRILILCGIASVLLMPVVVHLRRRRIEQEISARVEAQMLERMRNARELHDTLLQSLQGLVLTVSNFSEQVVAPERPSKELQDALDCAEEVLLSARNRILDLRSDPAVRNDLLNELYSVVDLSKHRPHQTINVEVVGTPRKLKTAAQAEILWIMRKALTQTCRHSGTVRVHLEISYGRIGLRFVVHDDGGRPGEFISSTAQRDDDSMIEIREHVQLVEGRLSLQTGTGLGTILTVYVPARIAYA